MKKVYRKVVLLMVVFACLLSGCGNKKEYGLNPKDPEEVKIWHYYNGAQAIAFESAVAEFNNTVGLEKGIVVTAISKSSIDELGSALRSAAEQKVGAEEMPEVFQSYLDTAVQLDQYEMLTDLNQYVTEKEKSEYVDAYIEEGVFGDKEQWKLFPIAKSTEVLALNKTDWDHFAQTTGATIESLRTWEGLNETAEQYYKYSGGKSFFGRDAFANYMIVGSKQLGTEIFQVKDGVTTVALDKEVMKKLWDNFYVPYMKGYYKHVGRYRTDDVKLGEIIALVGATSGLVYFPTEVTTETGDAYPIEPMVLPLPNFKGTEPYAVQQGAGMAVVKTTPRKEYASVLFLKWFTQVDRNLQFALESGYMPVKKEANQSATIETYLQENEVELSELEKDTLFVAVEEVEGNRLFTSKGFLQGYEARTVLEFSMKDLAIQNREQIMAAVENGTSEEEAITEFLTESCFEDWYQAMKIKLEEVCR